MTKIKFYDTMTKKETEKMVKNLEWSLVGQQDIDNINDDGDSQMIASMYSEKQSFGFTDYNDHRKDSFEKLKKIMTKELLEEYQHQKLHMYNKDGKLLKKIAIKGFLGGITGHFLEESYVSWRYRTYRETGKVKD